MPAVGLALASFLSAAHASAAKVDPVDAFIRRSLKVSHYKRADADLNGDGRLEVFVYETESCGSGGCDLIVLSPRGKGYRRVMDASVSQLPINLLQTSTRGWRDIGVTVGGGGITRPYMARLRFDGRRYTGNPTVPPAIPLKRPKGKLLIGR